jgi:hypothetical protein
MDLILPNEIRPCVQMATGGRHDVFDTGPDKDRCACSSGTPEFIDGSQPEDDGVPTGEI